MADTCHVFYYSGWIIHSDGPKFFLQWVPSIDIKRIIFRVLIKMCKIHTDRKIFLFKVVSYSAFGVLDLKIWVVLNKIELFN